MRYVIDLVKAGPYIGPRGGKWADPMHTIPYKESEPRMGKTKFKREMNRRRAEGCVVSGPKTFQYKEIIKAAGGIWDSWEKQWLVPSREIATKLMQYMQRGGPITPAQASAKKPVSSMPEVASVAGDAGKLQEAQEEHIRQCGLVVSKTDFDQFWADLRSAAADLPDYTRRTFMQKLGLMDLVKNTGAIPSSWLPTGEGETQLRGLTRSEMGVLLDAVRSIAVKESRAEPGRDRRAKEESVARDERRRAQNLANLKAGKARIQRGSGYGGRDFKEGEVFSHPEFGLVTVVSSSKKYFSEDGLTFGVGDESGYIFRAMVRQATEDEAQEFLSEKARVEQRQQKVERLDALGSLVRSKGHWPTGNPEPKGDRLFDTRNPYGGGSWFVVEPDDKTVWFVMNNGADGDDWSRNNIRTGGAGAIGWKLTDESVAQELLELAAKLNGRERDVGG